MFKIMAYWSKGVMKNSDEQRLTNTPSLQYTNTPSASFLDFKSLHE
jgi:hypothetical protein